MFLSTLFAAGRFRGRGAVEEASEQIQIGGSEQFQVSHVDSVATVLLGTMCAIFLWLDCGWSRHFVKRVGNVCGGRAGDLFNFTFVCLGVYLAQHVL